MNHNPSSRGQVSIICPVYNTELYLEETIASVMQQSHIHWELLLVIDAKSSDQSLKLAQKWAYQEPRIRCLQSESNLGVAHNRNFGIQQAKGEFIAFLDSDDLWHPQKLEKQILFMKSQTLDFSYHSYQQMSEKGQILPLIRKAPPQVTYSDLLKTNSLGCLTIMIRTAVLKQYSFQPHLPHEDFLLWLEILKQIPKAHGLNEILAYYRVLPHSRSGDKKRAARDRWNIYRKVLGFSFFQSLYYFSFYSIIAITQRLKARH